MAVKKFDVEKNEFKETVVDQRRVAKTVKGGRIMRQSALVVVGDGNEIGRAHV